MTSLVRSTTISFPSSTTVWSILPLRRKRSNRREKGHEKGSRRKMDQHVSTEDTVELGYADSTGVEHWEEQRRRWTRDFKNKGEDAEDNVSPKVKYATKDRLVRWYQEITNLNQPFPSHLRLADLIPILVAGWKEAGLWPLEETLRREILQRQLNPDDYDLTLHLASILDSDADPEKELDVNVTKVLARQKSTKP